MIETTHTCHMPMSQGQKKYIINPLKFLVISWFCVIYIYIYNKKLGTNILFGESKLEFQRIKYLFYLKKQTHDMHT